LLEEAGLDKHEINGSFGMCTGNIKDEIGEKYLEHHWESSNSNQNFIPE